MKLTTAVIMASGYGTRMLPVTAAVQKELLPLLNRPVIDYVVADCVAAGISRILFVVRPGSHGLQDYYQGVADLEDHLQRFNKTEALELLKGTHSQAQFEFIEQPVSAGYGTAVPLRVARPHLPKDEAVAICYGDDFIYHADGTSELASLAAAFNSYPTAAGAVSGLERPEEELSRYGVLKTKRVGERELLEDLVEKPAPGHAPSNLINLGKYIATPTLLDYVEELTPDKTSGELYLTDAVLATAKEHAVVVHHSQGQHLDTGNQASWLKANLVLAQASPALRSIVKS